MAAARSAQNPHQWPNGEWHSITWAQEQQRRGQPAPGAPQKGIQAQSTLPPPPPGTYDPILDYQKGAAQRGYLQTSDDAATQYEQGQEDYGSALKGLTTGRDRTLADLLTQEGNVKHGYQVLGGQQAEHARQQGITSAGLLALSQEKRDANQAHDLAPLTLAEGRANEDFATGKQGLDAQNARIFGGYGGHALNDPITGQPVVGSLATGLARAGTENQAYQGGLLQQMIAQAQQGGYSSPLLQPSDPAAFSKKLHAKVPGVYINGRPVTQQQYQHGDLLNAMLGRS